MCYRVFREVLLNLSRTAIVGTEASGHCRRVVVEEGLKKSECIDCPPKKMAVVESSRWSFVEVRLQEMDSKVCHASAIPPSTALYTAGERWAGVSQP